MTALGQAPAAPAALELAVASSDIITTKPLLGRERDCASSRGTERQRNRKKRNRGAETHTREGNET